MTSFSFQTAVFLGSCFLQHPVFACQCRRATSGALLPRPCHPIWRRCPCNSYEGHLVNACACITLPPADSCAQHRNTNQGLFEVLAWFLVCSPRVLHRATRVSQCRCDPCSSYQVNCSHTAHDSSCSGNTRQAKCYWPGNGFEAKVVPLYLVSFLMFVPGRTWHSHPHG